MALQQETRTAEVSVVAEQWGQVDKFWTCREGGANKIADICRVQETKLQTC